MKHFYKFLLLAITVSSCGSSCNKDKDKWEEVVFEFVVPLTITPVADSINVGQELILSAYFPDSLFDYISQKKYYLPNFNFKTVAAIRKLTNKNASITEQTSAVSKLQISNSTGGFSDLSATFAFVNYIYQNNNYALSVKLKVLERGVYAINFFHDTRRKGQSDLPTELSPSIPGIKRFPIMRLIRYNFNNGTTQFNIYKDNCKPADPNETTNWVESKATYTFVVK